MDPPAELVPEQADEPLVLPRRAFLRRSLFALGGLGAMGAYPFAEACWLKLTTLTVTLPNLPKPFVGLRVAVLSDIHHGPLTSKKFIRKVVDATQALGADVIVLVGDFVHADRIYIEPCFDVLAPLKAPMGVHAVLGNHDHWEGEGVTRDAIAHAGFSDLTNTGHWIEKDGARLRIGGVGDLWEDEQDLAKALADVRDDETSLILSHNPDFAEIVDDPRVGLVLSGHTHGGQVYIPGYGAPLVPSAHDQKYRYGLVQAPMTQVFVSSGIGTIYPPVRLACRPEIVLITLA